MYKDKSYKYAEIYGVICMHICLFIHGVMTRKSCNYTRAILSFRSCCILPRTLLCSYMCVIPGISDAFHAHHRLRVIIQNHHPDLGEHENATGRRGWSPVFSYSEKGVMDIGHFGRHAGPYDTLKPVHMSTPPW